MQKRSLDVLLAYFAVIALVALTPRALAQSSPCAPALLLMDADGSLSTTNVLVTFSAAISAATATNKLNYKITNTISGAALTINSAVLTNGTMVLLGTSARTAGQNYLLVVNNIQEAVPGSATIASNSQTPVAAAIVTLVGMNSSYRYYNPILFFDNANLGTAWKAPDYNDSDVGASESWGNGSSIFYGGADEVGVPGSINTYLDLTDTVISYFRSAFNVPFSPGNVRLYLTHIVDDGALFYLNGGEIQRFNMPDGPITYDTPALTSLAAITRSDPILIPSSLIVTGRNVLAVELHQYDPVDIDRAYGAQLEARVMSYVTGKVMITSGVADTTVLENQPVTFETTSVAANRFQWQMNNTNLLDGTNSTYTIRQAPLALNGARFRVIVNNSTSSATSTNGTLRVIADTNPPTILSAILTTSNNTVQVLYSEPITTASATNPGNYIVTNSLGQVQLITGIAFRNDNNVILTLAPPSGADFRLAIKGVRDIAAAANAVSNTVIKLGINHLAVTRTDGWKYLLVSTNQSVQTNYYKLTYDDSASGSHGAWSGPSPSVLYVEPGQLAPGWTKNTELALVDAATNRINTFYFRKKISTTFLGGTVNLQGRVLFDDGLVLYLNGVELQRFNMPTGTIAAATQASRNWENTESVPVFDLVVTNWIAGDNLLAAEVHQNGPSSGDVVFGLELNAFVPDKTIATGSPGGHLTLVRCGGLHVIEWTHGGILERANDVTGPWQPVASISPHLVSVPNTTVFYRVRH